MKIYDTSFEYGENINLFKKSKSSLYEQIDIVPYSYLVS